MKSDLKDTHKLIHIFRQRLFKMREKLLQKAEERKKRKKCKTSHKHPVRYAIVSGLLLSFVTAFLGERNLTYLYTSAAPSSFWENLLSEFDTLYSTFILFESDEWFSIVCLGFFSMVLFGLISKGLEAKGTTVTESIFDWFFVILGNVFCQMLIERIILSNGLIVQGLLALSFIYVIIPLTILIGLIRKITGKTFMSPITKRIWAPVFAHLIVLVLGFLLLIAAMVISNRNRYSVLIVFFIQAAVFFRLSNHLVDRLGDGYTPNDKKEDILGGRTAIITMIILFVLAAFNVASSGNL